jgi:uncharacterized phage-like protein YoqJ
MNLMVTGHRSIVPMGHVGPKYPEHSPIVRAHHAKLIEVITNFVRSWGMLHSNSEFISGMAIGADQLFAQAVLEAGGRFVCAIPFQGQDSNWPESSRAHYRQLIQAAFKVVHVCEPGYAAWKMQRRNEWMVDNSASVLAVWNGTQKGGTWNCIQYAQSKQKPIYWLNSETLKFQ